MHELSLAQSLIESIELELNKQQLAGTPCSRVLSVKVSMGELSGVEEEVMQFCFPEAARGTQVEGAQFIIEKVPVSVRCDDCGKESTPHPRFIQCMHCKQRNVKILAGKEFRLLALEVE